MRMFVYGTLKRGYHNHRLLKSATFLGRARTAEPYVLLDSGFPVMIPIGAGSVRVTGEVYEFEDRRILKRLDQLEGEGSMYDRVQIEVEDVVGEPMTVWTYVGCAEAFANNSLGVQWLDGDLFDYRDVSVADEEDAA